MYPEWVTKHRKKGTNISCINGRYYLYAVSSVWNKEKGRAQKVTNKYLGRITEEGLMPPKEKRPKIEAPILVKEYGAAQVLSELGADVLSELRNVFGTQGELVFVIAALRMIEQCPFKRVEHLYQNSYLSEIFRGLRLSGKDISLFLSNFGGNREKIVDFMKRFIGANEHILFDGTAITSKSEKMNINRKGYNAKRDYDPQINLLYAFGCDNKMPGYYRIIPGCVRDVTAFELSISESGLHDVVVVADKGFASDDNFKMLNKARIKYIVPLKRNSSLFDDAKLKTGSKASFDGYFMFNERPIWYYKSGETFVFLDNDLKNDEEKKYLRNIEKKLDGYTMAGFEDKQYKFGTIIIKTNAPKSAQDLYNLYKERGEIEQSFDFLKNLLEQDKSYMQNEKSLESWAFINHISLLLNYKIYNLLRGKKLLSKFSVADFLSHLKYIFKAKINGEWITTEYTKKTKELFEVIELHIT